jgi:hypothetical protein
MSKQVGPGEEQSHQAARERAYRRYPNINKQLLTDLYYTQGFSTVDIAKHLGVSRNLIWEYMEMYDLKRRTPGQAGAMKSRVYFVNERYFQHIDEPDKAYIVGFILGDGTLVDRRKSKRLVLAVADGDGELVECIAERLNCSELVRRRQRPNTLTEQLKTRLAVNSTRMVDDLVALGVPLSPKSGKEPFIEFPTSDLTWAFLRGASDADGCIRVYQRSSVVKGKLYGPYRRARWSITIGMPFVHGLKDFLEREGIILSAKCIRPKQGTGLLEVAAQKTIREIARHLYRYGSLWLQRKKDIFDSLV